MTQIQQADSKLMVISGGSKGIGAATCERFSKEGYTVVNLSRTKSSCAAAINLTCDMSDPDWIGGNFDQLRELASSASSICLIHNAGLLLKDSVEDIAASDFHRVLQINVVAASQLNQLLLPSMSAGSSIIYVASTLGEKAVANSCSYVVSKHAMIGLMRATTQDLFGKGIHTCSVCPGFTDTEMLRDHVGNDQSILDALSSGVSFGRLIKPAEIADSLWFSAQSPVVNGAVLHANLGQLES